MSRIGKQPIAIPAKVKVEIKGQKVFVEGPKGKLDFDLPKRTAAKVDAGQVIVSRTGEDAEARALHGLSRSILNNMVKGVTTGGGGGGGMPMLAGGGVQGVPRMMTTPDGQVIQVSVDPSTGQPLALPNPDIDSKIDIAKIEGQVKASSVKRVSEFVDKHPEESVSILRSWLHETA